MTLAALIADLRAALLAEAPLRLHTAAIPTPTKDHDGASEPTYGHLTGLPFTARFQRYLGHWESWGASRLAMLSILEVSDYCHGLHTGHVIPGSSRSLCSQLLFEVCYLGQSVNEVSWIHLLPTQQTERMLLQGLRHAKEWREQRERRVDAVPGVTGREIPRYQPLLRRGRPAA